MRSMGVVWSQLLMLCWMPSYAQDIGIQRKSGSCVTEEWSVSSKLNSGRVNESTISISDCDILIPVRLSLRQSVSWLCWKQLLRGSFRVMLQFTWYCCLILCRKLVLSVVHSGLWVIIWFTGSSCTPWNPLQSTSSFVQDVTNNNSGIQSASEQVILCKLMPSSRTDPWWLSDLLKLHTAGLYCNLDLVGS